LEDVNITGARGILVNITAGPNLGMNEIAEIGAHIEALASEDATVVVGTAIDESMEERLRVTLVATGLGVQNVAVAPTAKVSLVEPVVARVEKDRDFKELERPAKMRADEAEMKNASDGSYNEDLLDIPAFLRRQAD
jgi:cell division protein FtsZ